MRTILIAEDESDIVEILKLRFEALGYQVVTAQDGTEAVKALAVQKPDLIIMDIMMPKMNGIKACGLIKADKRFCDIPIIMLTASASQEDRTLCQQVGANEFCPKPLNIQELIQKVGQLIDRPKFS